jgi:hypothetical protein
MRTSPVLETEIKNIIVYEIRNVTLVRFHHGVPTQPWQEKENLRAIPANSQKQLQHPILTTLSMVSIEQEDNITNFVNF